MRRSSRSTSKSKATQLHCGHDAAASWSRSTSKSKATQLAAKSSNQTIMGNLARAVCPG